MPDEQGLGFSWVTPAQLSRRGKAKVQPIQPWMAGWQLPNADQNVAIAAKYASPDEKAYREWLAATPEANPNLASEDGVAPPVTEQAFFDPDSLKNTEDSGRHPITGETLTDKRRKQFFAEGGTAHTLHQTQVAGGVRPPMDGRAPLSRSDAYAKGSPSADIEAGWGWPKGDAPEEGDDYAFDPSFGKRAGWIPAAPTSRLGAQQKAAWDKRFDDARARIYDSLGS